MSELLFVVLSVQYLLDANTPVAWNVRWVVAPFLSRRALMADRDDDDRNEACALLVGSVIVNQCLAIKYDHVFEKVDTTL
jgi:hypothetical protein